MQVIKESHIAPVPAVHMRRIDDLDVGIAADVQRFGELGHYSTCRRRFHRRARSHEVVLHIDDDHGGLLRVNHVNLHDLPPRLSTSDVLLPMTTGASAGAYFNRVLSVQMALIWLIIGIASALHGCATTGEPRQGGLFSYNPSAYERRLDERLQFLDKTYIVVRVFYATDRNRTQSTKPSEFFGIERSELSYGTCEVSIPKDHRMGAIEAPSMWRLQFREDPEKHVVLLSVTPAEKHQYFTELVAQIRTSAGKNAFVFVHGYNVTFEDAAKRTAQIAYDLGFDGAPVLYSWPSQGTFEGYPVDETNIEWTQAHLRRFLDDFVVHTTADNLYLIAHSMGNRALVRVFSTLVSNNPALRQRFRAVILTAPDIDAEVFRRDIAPQIVGERSSVTLYVSAEDKALLASKKFHGYPRAGDASDGLVIVPGIDTIDATGLDTSFLKHSYFAEVRSVLADIFYLIREGKRPEQRFALEPVNIAAGRYWKFKR